MVSLEVKMTTHIYRGSLCFDVLCLFFCAMDIIIHYLFSTLHYSYAFQYKKNH